MRKARDDLLNIAGFLFLLLRERNYLLFVTGWKADITLIRFRYGKEN